MQKYAISLGLLLSLSLALTICQAAVTSVDDSERNDYVFLRSWGGEGYAFRKPRDVAIGPDGTIFVANTGIDRITVISSGDHLFVIALLHPA